MSPPPVTGVLEGRDLDLFHALRLKASNFEPLLTRALFSMVPIAAPELGTFAVDRHWRCYVDMEQARKWGASAAAAVLLHEAHHLVRDHGARAEAKGVTTNIQHQVFNLCADAAINDDLVEAGHPLPSPVLPSSLGFVDGGIEEEYYDQIVMDEAPGSPGCGSGAGGEPLEVELDREAAPIVDTIDAQEIREAIEREIARSPSRGTSAGDLLRRATANRPARAAWRSLLRAQVLGRVLVRPGVPQPTWSRPNRRADGSDPFLVPGKRYFSRRIAVVIDTSGSMDRRLLDAAAAELNGLISAVRCQHVMVLSCDTEVGVPQRMRRFETLELRGGGGTDMRIGIRAAGALSPRPDLIVVLTDGETPWPDEAPSGTSVLALVLSRSEVLPSGRGIRAIRVDEW